MIVKIDKLSHEMRGIAKIDNKNQNKTISRMLFRVV